jgi:GST-like protein
VQRWRRQINERPAARRGSMVNKLSGDPATQLHERHDASDFELKTQDKLSGN